MPKKFSELHENLSSERRARIDAKKREILKEIDLHELRLARKHTQEMMAEIMGIPQSAVSKIERRTDAYISTVRRYLQALGGDLRITAIFPDGTAVEIEQFRQVAEPNRKK